MANTKKKLTATDPLDELFKDQPEATRALLRQHKGAKRAQDRSSFMDRQRSVDLGS